MKNMSRREFLKSVPTAAATFGIAGMADYSQASASSTPSAVKKGKGRKKPNVIVVLCDQLRTFALGCYGNKFVKTPNIDKLADNGFRFDLGVTDSPVCVPARSNLLSGQYARTCVGSRRNEIAEGSGLLCRNDRLKFPDTSLPEAFKKLGYKTALIGKWHVDTKPSLLGFDQSLLPGNIFTKGTFVKDEGKPFGVPGFTSDYEILAVKDFLGENKDEPFFLYYNIISPHMPLLDVPYKYSRMYDPAKVPLRENVWKDGKLPSNETWFQIYMWQTHIADNPPITSKATPDFTLKDLTALYYGSVTWVDDLMGELMQSLKDNGLEDDTIVIFTSDHGDMLGSHHKWNKDRLYEEAIRVPLIIQAPGMPDTMRGRKLNTLALNIDIAPTILDMAGIQIPSEMDGMSLYPLLSGRDAPSRADFFMEHVGVMELWGINND